MLVKEDADLELHIAAVYHGHCDLASACIDRVAIDELSRSVETTVTILGVGNPLACRDAPDILYGLT